MNPTASLKGARVHRVQFVGGQRSRKECIEAGVSLADTRFAASQAWERANDKRVIQDAEMRVAACTQAWQVELDSWAPGLAEAMGEDDLSERAAEWFLTWTSMYARQERTASAFCADEVWQ